MIRALGSLALAEQQILVERHLRELLDDLGEMLSAFKAAERAGSPPPPGHGGNRPRAGSGDTLPRVPPPLCGLGLCARAVFVTGTRCYRAAAAAMELAPVAEVIPWAASCSTLRILNAIIIDHATTQGIFSSESVRKESCLLAVGGVS